MTGKTHDLAAFGALIIAAAAMPERSLTLSTIVCVFLANQIGGIAPDIDQPTAPLWNLLPIGGAAGRVVDRLLGGHRGLSHSLLGLGIFGFAVHWLLTFFHPLFPTVDAHLVWLAFMIGFLSHLVMDTLTKEGVVWLLPIPVKWGIPPLRAWRITTDSWVEKFLVAPLLVVGTLGLVYQYYTHFVAIFHQLKR